MKREDIIKKGNQALIRELGLDGMITYIQYFNSGYSSYEKRRKNWQFARHVADVAKDIAAMGKKDISQE